MPNRRPWGVGIGGLLVAGAESRAPISTELERAGLTVKYAAGEAGALSALESESLQVALVAHAVGPSALSSIIARAKQCHPEVPVVVLGSSSTVEEAVDVMRRGAADYLPPPIDPRLLALRVRGIFDRSGSAEGATEHSGARASDFFGLVGTSTAMARVFETIAKVSRYKTNILLLGESGTGKELIARALHARGPRRQHLFVPINCATLGRELLENELFGHERGAFTGASERKKGLFELADGGTLFFDEIGEMDPSTQAKLLRVLERNEFRRVGGTNKVRVDLCVLAATNRNLPDLIAAGKFREDLYYRLKVVTLVIPPLRERKEDVPALINSFIADFNRRNGGKIRGISPELLKRVMEYDWPGNVRELKNAVESAAILAGDDTLETEWFEALPTRPGAAAARTSGELQLPIDCTLAEAERRIILARTSRIRRKDEAARSLGIGLRTLYTKLATYQQE
jgi:DNA-binding NtrC family response regulator